jgi:hypothetical protein
MKKNGIIIVLFLVLGAVAFYLYKSQTKGTVKQELKDFAIADTASIDKLFLADRDGNSVLLSRSKKGYWVVNNEYRAKQGAISTLLYTIKEIEVRSPVGKNLYNNTMKLMSSKSTKIEIYQKGVLTMTYYVGHPTMDNKGTFMYLEGSTVPFIMQIPGFNGFLSTRYFATANEWKDPAVFRFEARRINLIKVENFSHPEKSFVLRKEADSLYVLTATHKQERITPIDKLKLRNYLLTFEKTNYQRVDNRTSKAAHDSISKVGPFVKIDVADDIGNSRSANLYRLPVTVFSKNAVDQETGDTMSFDPDNFLLTLQGDTTWYLGQYFHFKLVVVDPYTFRQSKDRSKH